MPQEKFPAMKAHPWRFLVITDAGVDSGRPARVAPDGAGDWLTSLGVALDVPPPAGGGTNRIELRDPSDFGPGRVAEQLASKKAGGAAAPGTAAPGAADQAAIDAVLHHPPFRRVESAWRGLRFLLEHAAAGVQVEALSVPRNHLVARFREAIFEPELRRADPPSLILADFDFSHRAEDVAAFTELAGMAKVLQAPLVASASAAFFDLRFLVQVVALQDLLARLADAAHAGWQTFQASEAARWTLLTVNRYLQRAPYTAAEGGHAEAVSESNPESYLWGRGVWLVGAAVARSVRTHGHALAISGSQGGRFDGVATRAYPTAANATSALAAEVPLSEMQTLELSRAAFTPVVGPLRTSTVLLPMVLTTFRLTPGKLTLEATLAYQLTAARLAQFCGQLMEELPAGKPAEVVSLVRKELTGFLGPLAGDHPEDAVRVELREQQSDGKKTTVAEVSVRSSATLEGKALEFDFALPLTRD